MTDIKIKNLVRASKSRRRYSLYSVKRNGITIGFISKSFYDDYFRVGTATQKAQTFSTLKIATAYVVNHPQYAETKMKE